MFILERLFFGKNVTNEHMHHVQTMQPDTDGAGYMLFVREERKPFLFVCVCVFFFFTFVVHLRKVQQYQVEGCIRTVS